MAWLQQEAVNAEKALNDLESFLEKPQHPSRPRKPSLSGETSFLPGALQDRPKPKANRTAYLDGLRGVAALLVYSLHHEGWSHSKDETILESAFGWNQNYHFICFPGIRILFSGGHIGVAILFVISGYVLTAGPLRSIQSNDTVRLADGIGSALFRRWIRLYIPVLATTFIWLTSWHLLGIRSSTSFTPAPEKTYMAELWRWYCDFKNYSFIFTGDPWNAYNDHTWSIPLEFRGSIVVYGASLAFARLKTNKRIWCEVGLIVYFLYIVDGWYCALFMVGMLLCDLDLLAEKDELPAVFLPFRKHSTWLPYVSLLASLYLGGVPSSSSDVQRLRDSPGWYLLSFLKPQAVFDVRWFFRFWAASLMVLSVPHLPWLKAFFETSFCQYLGRVSYGFYLVHGPVLWSVGDRLYAASGRIRESHVALVPHWINLAPFSGWGPFGLEINYLVPHLILLPLTLCLAEAVTKFIDGPSVRFAQWLFSHDLPAKRGD